MHAADKPVQQQSLGWYTRRLSVMGAAELAHRVNEQWSIRVMRVTQAMRHAWGGDPDYEPQRFDFCTAATPRLPELPWAFAPSHDEIENLLAGKGPALGYGWSWEPDGSVWHRAPDTGILWPRTFFGSISHRAGNPHGDVRAVWEPSRLQHLIALGLLSRSEAPDVSRRATELVETQLLSWIEASPFLTGVHYLSVMECGLRILAVCHALDLVRTKLRDPENVWAGALHLVEHHARLIEHRLSLYSSTGNHTIAECAGLVYAGTLFPEVESAGRWRGLGVAILERESARQILPDGGGLEQSFWYLAFIVDLYGLVAALLHHRKRFVPHVIRYAATRGREFLAAFADAPDDLPAIGDADHGYALSPHLRLSWRERRQEASLTTFSDAGYSLLRCGRPEAGTLVFDHSSLGMAPSYGHGHADALSVTLRWGNRDVLIDPGTYTYTGDWPWRAYFRGTPAHNTVTVDGLDQARQETPFMWSRPFSSILVRSERTTDGGVRLLARHDGYRGVGVEHWRAVIYRRPGFLLIWDALVGAGSHQLDLHWHLGVEPIRKGDGFALSGLAQPSWLRIEGGETTVHRGDLDPIRGWRSRTYGHKEASPTLRARFEGPLPHEFVTRIQIGDEVFAAPIEPDLLPILREWVRELSLRQRSLD